MVDWEIPPRARRREFYRVESEVIGGNTSACAEKRTIPTSTPRAIRKYLRVRGEEG